MIIIQLAGTKYWKIFGQGSVHPLYRDTDIAHPRPNEPIDIFKLTPGDVLYMPRGCWHDVAGSIDGSLHLTLGFTRRVVADALSDFVDNLRTHELWRTDLEPASTRATRAQTQAAVSLIVEQLPRLDLADYQLRRRALMPLNRDTNLIPLSRLNLQDASSIEATARVPFVLHDRGEIVALQQDGREYRLPAKMAPILNELRAKRILSLAELSELAQLSHSDFSRAVITLLKQRIAIVY